MSRRLPVRRVRDARFPRVSGDEPLAEAFRQRARQFSPRERG